MQGTQDYGPDSKGSQYTSPATPLNTNLLWDFGDNGITNADYVSGIRTMCNTLTGFNAAHIYDTPSPSGVPYKLTLTVTDLNGVPATAPSTSMPMGWAQSQIGRRRSANQRTHRCTISSTTAYSGKTIFYVDSRDSLHGGNGDDSHAGTDPAAPLKTLAQAIKDVNSSSGNVQVRFLRDDSFDVTTSQIAITKSNVLFGSYGSISAIRPDPS